MVYNPPHASIYSEKNYMIAKSSPERGKMNRELARSSGFTEVKMTARSAEDLKEIEELKDRQLVRYFEQLTENKALSPSTREAVFGAITLQGSKEYITPHGAIGHIITTLMDNGTTAEVVPVIQIYSACYPTSLGYVLKSLPAKVMNYLCRETNTRTVTDWTEQNPDWAEKIVESVKNGSFDDVLSQIRTDMGSMSINPAVLSMLRRLKEDSVGVNSKALEQASQILDNATNTLTQSPRQWDKDCNELRTFILFFLECDLEKRYGEMEFPDVTYHVPFYAWEREEAGISATGVVSFHKDFVLSKQYQYGLCIGWRYNSWDQFFYQVAMGAVFLLNPRMGPVGTVKTSTLEAGVAIRYAEEMLEKYLPNTSRARVESPVGLDNKYDQAYQAARNIPDDVLRKIRVKFNGFGSITDHEEFYRMTSQYISAEEARLLSSDFTYQR